jgi:hypothetical protein
MHNQSSLDPVIPVNIIFCRNNLRLIMSRGLTHSATPLRPLQKTTLVEPSVPSQQFAVQPLRLPRQKGTF